MGKKADQDAVPSTYRPGAGEDASPPASESVLPPLPPRGLSVTSPPEAEPPPAYTEVAPTYHFQPVTQTWSAQDPRSSSTQSLVPHGHSEDENKRRLLLIWVHGFMGNETSFQSFPAHVHNAITQKLQVDNEGTHVVHTKIYPRYKSRNKIDVARDAFSEWLAPHENANTDVLLLGHSLGGILAAEVALKPALAGEHRQYRHRIFGTINFDTPFLGMHPGVISSGLGSLFKPAPEAPSPTTPSESRASSIQPEAMASGDSAAASARSPYFQADSSTFMPSETLTPTTTTSTTTLPLSSPISQIPTNDPNYDPPFTNDVRRPQRSGWSNAWHFVNKHADGLTLMAKSNALTLAAKSYVTSHFEFGGCLADYNGLKVRYKALKDLDESKKCRFVNYYTASTGRVKNVVSTTEEGTAGQDESGKIDGQADGQAASVEEDLRNMAIRPSGDPVPSSSRISNQEAASGEGSDAPQAHESQHLSVRDAVVDDDGATSEVSSMVRLSPAPVEDSEDEQEPVATAGDDPEDLALSDAEPAIIESNQSDNTLAGGGVLPPKPTQPAITLPPIPALPEAPAPFDPSPYTDKDTRKLAEKEHARTIKHHERLVKDRDRAIKDRRKLIEKRDAAAKKEIEKKEKELAKGKAKAEKHDQATGEEKRLREESERMEKEARRMRGEPADSAPLSQNTATASIAETGTEAGAGEAPNDGAADDTKPKKEKPQKEKGPPKDKKFCLLPPMINGKPDPCWIRVFMPGVDEVGAHCGLFFVDGERYEWFVGDVAERIEGWIALAACGQR